MTTLQNSHVFGVKLANAVASLFTAFAPELVGVGAISVSISESQEVEAMVHDVQPDVLDRLALRDDAEAHRDADGILKWVELTPGGNRRYSITWFRR